MQQLLPIGPDKPWLAPLAGYSDLAFRLLCRENGAAVACTEMVSAKGIYFALAQGHKARQFEGAEEGSVPGHSFNGDPDGNNLKGAWALLNSCPSDSPLVVQLFGSESEIMPVAMQAVQDFFGQRPIWFDLNLGCSVPKVVKTGAGAALLKDKNLCLKVARAMLEFAKAGRVGFKLRLGWEKGQDIYLDLARELEQMGAAWVSLHPRYARQGFGGQADWAALERLKEALGIPVLASGDLLSPQAACHCLAQTGVDGVMFERGALYSPQIFNNFKMLLAGKELEPSSPRQLTSLVRRHIDLARRYAGDARALSCMRGFIPRYVHDFPGVRALRQTLATCQSFRELDMILDNFLKNDDVITRKVVD